MEDKIKNNALIFDIKRDCSEDGPGIRTTVFFKGCPLSCEWCQNPESISNKPQLSFRSEACNPSNCDIACLKVCESHCLSFIDRLHVNHDQCSRCDRCFDVCPSKALEPSGYWITLDELMYRISIDMPFYQSSGGGVTLSGGEATQQMSFIHRFLKELKRKEIHTAIETNGFFNYRKFEKQVLPYLDLIYFDLKLIDSSESKRYTGQSNKLIFDNFEKLVQQADIPIIPRIPLIPGVTTSKRNLSGIAQFLKRLSVNEAALMPYNPLWQDKLERLNLKSNYKLRSIMTAQEKMDCIENFYSDEESCRPMVITD